MYLKFSNKIYGWRLRPLPAPGLVTQWLMLVNIVSSGENIDSGLFPDRENIPEVAIERENWPISSQESVSWPMRNRCSYHPFPVFPLIKTDQRLWLRHSGTCHKGSECSGAEKVVMTISSNYPLSVSNGIQGGDRSVTRVPHFRSPGDTCLNPFPVSHLHWVTSIIIVTLYFHLKKY